MTYDAGRRQVVAFGGETPTGLSGDLLAWDGSRWSCASTSGPRPRSDAVLAYDPARDVLVLYGGRAGRESLRDTWELTKGVWVRRDTLGPTLEAHGVAAYDASAGGILMFAGLGDDTPTRRTWLWDGVRWTTRAEEPTGQFPNAMFGGTRMRSARLMTTRRLGPGRHNPVLYDWHHGWSSLVTTGDLPVFSPQAPSALMANGILLYAGFEADRSVSTWTLDGTVWRKHTGESPSRRKGARMAFDVARGVVVMLGGDDGERLLGDTWEWDGRAWRRIR